jgi:hypothetical protein
MYNLYFKLVQHGQKIKKMKGGMDKCLFGHMFVITETKHTSEDKVCIQSVIVLIGPWF